MNQYLAHVKQGASGEWQIHDLDQHLRKVGTLAAEFAKLIGSPDWAELAGMWHDLGKYRKAFQSHIKSASDYKPDAHLESPGEDSQHAITGAIYAAQQAGPAGQLLAYLIAGHHAGLPDWLSGDGGQANLEWRLNNYESHLGEALAEDIPADILKGIEISTPPPKDCEPALWLRMLFSCLVDADYLDTEAFMSPEKVKLRGSESTLGALKTEFDGYMAKLSKGAAASPVNTLRQKILADCCDSANNKPGFFTLTVPTGGGKTLASMAFALRHALKHKKRRIIYVIPYTSIIEQTADVYRKAFGEVGDGAIVEHHSNMDYDEGKTKVGKKLTTAQRHANAQARIATENWDAPIIITTAVQFFESLFAAKPSRCRKLHNIVDSVIIFDEAQTLPVDFLEPILAALKQLVSHYGVSAVLCTATQPMLFEKPAGRDNFPNLEQDKCQEIISQPAELYEKLKRVRVRVPSDMNARTSWGSIAEKMASQPQSLCIVDRKAAALELFELLPEDGRFHLSTRMCGQHRSDVIATIKQRLKAKEPCRVVSTQLIEAGVDLDFPVVHRALAGLDSVAQAAGRCNREGRLEYGDVNLFIPPQEPPQMLKQAVDAGREALRHYASEPLALEAIASYFQSYYWRHGKQLDKYDIRDLLSPKPVGAGMSISFRTVANRFRLIDDGWQAPIIVRYRNEPLLEQLERVGPEKWLLRKLQRYVVNIPSDEHHQFLKQGDIQELASGIFIQEGDVLYRKSIGVQPVDNMTLIGFGVA